VNKLKQETDVMINIPDSNSDHGNTIIRIEGSKEGVQKAKKVSEGFIKLLPFLSPNDDHKYLLFELPSTA
jgi:hypothetical protein